MNIPNILTVFRLFLIPVFVYVFFSNTQAHLQWAVVVFLTAGVTDVLDGYIARKYKLVTKVGMVLDPLADKLMLLTVLTCLFIAHMIPAWVLSVILLKELFMIVKGTLLYRTGVVIPANKFGKASTLLFYISIFTLCVNKSVGLWFIYAAALSAIIAFFNYLLLYYSSKHKL